MAQEPMQGKCTSASVDMGYTNLFCILVLTSVFFSSFDSAFGCSLEFHQRNRGSLRFDWEPRIPLHKMEGHQASSCGEGEVS